MCRLAGGRRRFGSRRRSGGGGRVHCEAREGEEMSKPRSKPTYVLGTGLSHNGSACLLRDGEICVAIEKERLTRKKHDGHNDTMAINYCLQAEGITVDDLDLVVQHGNFAIANSYYQLDRLFTHV